MFHIKEKILAQVLLTISSLIIAGLFVFPGLAYGQSFVPCEGVDLSSGIPLPDCNACHFAEMANTVIVWLIGLLFIIFAVMLFSAGWGLVVSAGNIEAVETAKNRLRNAFIGILVVLAAWLIVDTLMRQLLNGGDLTMYSGFSVWSEIECVAQPASTVVIVRPGDSTVSTGQRTCAFDSGTGANTDCSALLSDCAAQSGTSTVDTTTDPTNHTVDCETPTGVAAGGACDGSTMSTINFLSGRITVANSIVPQLNAIHADWQAAGGNSFYRVTSVGAYNCRQVTGGTRYSVHAYGLAIDINPGANGYGPKQTPCPSDMPSSFVSMFRSRGFGWGGAWNSVCDAMHFSAASNEGGWISI